MWLQALPLQGQLVFFEGPVVAASQRFELVLAQEPISFGLGLFPVG